MVTALDRVRDAERRYTGVVESVEKFETRLASLENRLVTFEKALRRTSDTMNTLHVRLDKSAVLFWLVVVVVALVTSLSGHLVLELAQLLVAKWMS